MKQWCRLLGQLSGFLLFPVLPLLSLLPLLLLLILLLLLPAGNAIANSRVDAGGFLRIYAMTSDVNLPRHSRGAQRLWVPQIPLESQESTSGERSHLHAKESRVWLRADIGLQGELTPSKLSIYVEFDFNEEAESYQPRLRHAYGTVGNLLMGQTYTTFTNTSALADIEAAIAVGDIVTRQPQLRWTQTLPDDRYQFLVALEAAESRTLYVGPSEGPNESPYEGPNEVPNDGPGNGSTTINRNQHDTPADLVLRLNRNWADGNWSVAALTRQVKLPVPATGSFQTLRGNAISIAGRINTGVLHNLRFMVSHGDGLARHVTLSTYADAAIANDGRNQLISVSSGVLAYQHYWTNRLRSTFAYSWSRARLPDWADSAQTRQANHGNINLVWTLRPDTSVGIEVMTVRREVQDGRTGQLNRLQATLRLNL